ncbi:hypothetical protein AS156_15910 [Bradyrhizobium macuxiense]|uniref:Uncharacterized protein n=1 Tax=Bradyrhizobium macuxiense TaxID=1755647 RepID=A0A125Q713_9BRAD|nr:hypothetical protein [Bradyrhizobium macuxiense]KWV49652.1 hypothetical protein AS156_15910 [Bradyrhizobium macuxiense]
MKWLRRIAAVIGAAILVFVAFCASQIGYIQFVCTPESSASVAAASFGIGDPKYARAEGDSFLTYPEWYIVYAYADLAGVTRASSESSFGYYRSIRGFWSSLCGARRSTSADRPASEDQMVTDYIIGSSFTAEMAIQGLYERTIGALTVAWRGPKRTKEDEFNQTLLDDYAKFLEQTPWYRYPFADKLSALWHDVAFELSLRSVERRFSLSLQYGIKSLYAKAIGALAGLSPADLEIGSVVMVPSPEALPVDSRIRVVREVRASDGRQGVLMITPRYREFTNIVRKIGARGLSFGEIAGNTRILTTLLVPAGELPPPSGAKPIFQTDVQSMPGWRRVGYDTEVAAVAALPAAVEAHGARFEHAYDY